MDRNAVPFMQVDNNPTDIGNWESSGVLDVTSLFITSPGETLLIGDVQAHSVRSDMINNSKLAEGSQLFLVSKNFGFHGHKAHAITNEEMESTPSSNFASPNPVSGTLFIKEATDVEIYTLEGRLVISKAQATSIDVSKLESGIYMVKTSDGQSQKIIVENK